MKKLLNIILVAIIAIPNVIADNIYGGHMWGLGLGWPWMIIGMLIWVSFWILIIYLAYELISKLISKNKEDPLDIARKRLAKGEITKKEFQNIKKELKK